MRKANEIYYDAKYISFLKIKVEDENSTNNQMTKSIL
jgi:hypothetical protein